MNYPQIIPVIMNLLKAELSNLSSQKVETAQTSFNGFEQLSTWQYVCKMEWCSAIRNKVLIQATTWMVLKES